MQNPKLTFEVLKNLKQIGMSHFIIHIITLTMLYGWKFTNLLVYTSEIHIKPINITIDLKLEGSK